MKLTVSNRLIYGFLSFQYLSVILALFASRKYKNSSNLSYWKLALLLSVAMLFSLNQAVAAEYQWRSMGNYWFPQIFYGSSPKQIADDWCTARHANSPGYLTGESCIAGEQTDPVNATCYAGTFTPPYNEVCQGRTYYGILITQDECPAGHVLDTYTNSCVLPSDPDANLGKADCNFMAGNPVNMATGNKYQLEIDISEGQGLLKFERYYNSRALSGRHYPMGKKWTHTYSANLLEIQHNGVNGIYAYRADGGSHYFAESNGLYTSSTAPGMELVKEAGGWVLTLPGNSVESYNSKGDLVSMIDPNGMALSLNYDEFGRLIEVADDFGRQITLEYNWYNQLIAITAPSGDRTQYTFGNLGELLTVVYPDLTPADSVVNPTRTYHYEDARFPLVLTGITNEKGVR